MGTFTIAGTVLIVALLTNLRGKGMVSAASILIGIIAGFIVAAMLGEVRWGKIAAAGLVCVSNAIAIWN